MSMREIINNFQNQLAEKVVKRMTKIDQPKKTDSSMDYIEDNNLLYSMGEANGFNDPSDKLASKGESDESLTGSIRVRLTESGTSIHERKYLRPVIGTLLSKALNVAEANLSYFDRSQFGLNSVDTLLYNVSDTLILQRIILARMESDPMIGNVSNIIDSYVTGSGLRFNTSSPTLNKFLIDFWYANKMPQTHRTINNWTVMLGECPVIHGYSRKGKMPTVRIAIPHEITAIETAVQDYEARLFYLRSPLKGGYSPVVYKDIEYEDYQEQYGLMKSTIPNFSGMSQEQTGEPQKNERMQMFRIGFGPFLKGRSLVRRGLRASKRIDIALDDIAIKHHEAAKVLYHVSITGNGNQSLADVQGRRGPLGGSILVTTPDQKWEMLFANLNMSDSKIVMDMLVANFAAAVNLPAALISMDYSQNVYASLREANNPLIQFVRFYQDILMDHYLHMFRFAIKQAVENGDLPEYMDDIPDETDFESSEQVSNIMESILDNFTDENEISEKNFHKIYKTFIEATKDVKKVVKTKRMKTEEVVINFLFPQLSMATPFEMARILFVYDQMGLASQETLQTMANLVPSHERIKLMGDFLWEAKKYLLAKKLGVEGMLAKTSRADLTSEEGLPISSKNKKTGTKAEEDSMGSGESADRKDKYPSNV